MKKLKRLISGRVSWGVVVVLAGCVLICSTHLEAQTGPNAVFNSSGACSSSSHCTPSTAFIDVSVFVSQATTFCGILNYMLTPSNGIIPSSGAVIDARGLNSTNTSMTCTSSPWAGISNPMPPSTILLPATGGGTNVAPIVIPSGWVLPANTHLIGVADGDVATSAGYSYSGTTIQACKTAQPGCASAFSGTSTMLSMCSSACSGVSIENLSLDGQGDCVWD
jgi:hypothetical protein